MLGILCVNSFDVDYRSCSVNAERSQSPSAADAAGATSHCPLGKA
jgi:hypothetical protein